MSVYEHLRNVQTNFALNEFFFSFPIVFYVFHDSDGPSLLRIKEVAPWEKKSFVVARNIRSKI